MRWKNRGADNITEIDKRLENFERNQSAFMERLIRVEICVENIDKKLSNHLHDLQRHIDRADKERFQLKISLIGVAAALTIWVLTRFYG